MSKIEFEQISENEVEVVIPPETPMAMVQQLTKSFHAKGLVEDLSKSTLSVRYFVRQEDSVNQAADKLIKSLQNLAKDDEPYWTPKSQFANQKRVREMEIAERRAKNGIKQPTNVSPAPEPHVMPDSTPKVPAMPSAAKPMNAATSTAPKMYDHDPANQATAGGTGKRYAFITDPANKAEHPEGCDCAKCEEMEKSNYGKFKGGSQYNSADNAKRKANNIGDSHASLGPNSNVKAYSTKPGQMSGKAQADLTARIQNAANKKQPVKTWSPEQIAAENEKRGLKKAWGQHLPFPSAEEEILKLARKTVESGEHAAANQLANLMLGKQMLGEDAHPVVKSMMAPPPPQPTDEQMFGHLVPTEQMVKAAEQDWSGKLNNFFAEASKPLSSRFKSEEEELAYWSSIKVEDRDDGKSGY